MSNALQAMVWTVAAVWLCLCVAAYYGAASLISRWIENRREQRRHEAAKQAAVNLVAALIGQADALEEAYYRNRALTRRYFVRLRLRNIHYRLTVEREQGAPE